jgi:hypothetical protein
MSPSDVRPALPGSCLQAVIDDGPPARVVVQHMPPRAPEAPPARPRDLNENVEELAAGLGETVQGMGVEPAHLGRIVEAGEELQKRGIGLQRSVIGDDMAAALVHDQRQTGVVGDPLLRVPPAPQRDHGRAGLVALHVPAFHHLLGHQREGSLVALLAPGLDQRHVGRAPQPAVEIARDRIGVEMLLGRAPVLPVRHPLRRVQGGMVQVDPGRVRGDDLAIALGRIGIDGIQQQRHLDRLAAIELHPAVALTGPQRLGLLQRPLRLLELEVPDLVGIFVMRHQGGIQVLMHVGGEAGDIILGGQVGQAEPRIDAQPVGQHHQDLDRNAQGPGRRGQLGPVLPLGHGAVVRGHPVHEADQAEVLQQLHPDGPEHLSGIMGGLQVLVDADEIAQRIGGILFGDVDQDDAGVRGDIVELGPVRALAQFGGGTVQDHGPGALPGHPVMAVHAGVVCRQIAQDDRADRGRTLGDRDGPAIRIQMPGFSQLLVRVGPEFRGRPGHPFAALAHDIDEGLRGLPIGDPTQARRDEGPAGRIRATLQGHARSSRQGHRALKIAGKGQQKDRASVHEWAPYREMVTTNQRVQLSQQSRARAI